jgi:hypothetical protein
MSAGRKLSKIARDRPELKRKHRRILLTDEQIERYSRQIILPEVGGRGQERLLAANLTLLAEAEDLTPALNYLAGAGIGTIQLIAWQAAASIASQRRPWN